MPTGTTNLKQINLYKIQGDDFIKTDNTKRIASLVTEIQNGNKRAFDELYNLTKERAYFVAIQFIKNEDDVQDILQESYIKALSKIKELDKPESFQSWFNQIVANKSKDFLKKKKPMLFEAEENEVYEVLPDEDLNFRPEDSLDQSELQRTVMEVLDELNEEKRACVMMMYFEELSVSEIAQTLEIPEGTVKTRLFSARKDLKEKFSKRGVTSAYSVAPMGVVLWAMRKSCITAGAAFASSAGSATVLAGVTATTATAINAAAAATVTTAKATGGIGAKIAAMSFAKKVVAGVAAVAVIGGTTAGVVTVTQNGKNKAAPAKNAIVYVMRKEYTDGYFTYTLDDSFNATIVACDPSISGDVVIPSELSGHKVIAIGSRTIETTEDIPEDFYIHNPKEVIEIVEDFSGKTGAFIECNKATSITVPECIETIEPGSFIGCTNLTRFAVNENNPNYSSDESGVLFSKDKKTLVSYPTANASSTYTIPESVTEIKPYAFFGCKNIQNLKLSPNIKATNYFGFTNCSFDTIVLPEGVEKVNPSTFYICQYNEMYLPKSLTYIDCRGIYSYKIDMLLSGGFNGEIVIDEDFQVFYAGNDNEFKAITFMTGTDTEGNEVFMDADHIDGFILNTPAPY